ncbi:TIGR01777 family protein [Vibrio sp. HDW18]|uniref:TIGR01777 family oxidoreductase n=1 Tax=Vibrio chanodichtyis TaxID=3027932 RepID=A0ABT5UVK5_9VIBR|nr:MULTISPECIES: TIGR01777 family oxidoreductase [Vibrio]MDE1513446.1 TIGR01777 family oxidoreductase [Vibrio chanodichtyis]QIL86136.1 TIGR01777 family protein [Vibrio sp. HDW18]
MRILITGGSGFIGSQLIKMLSGHQLLVLTRDITKAHAHFSALGVLPKARANLTLLDSLDSLADFNQIDAVINLAGEPIADRRWTTAQKQRITDSRLNITEQLVAKIHASTQPPRVLLSGSAVGWYGDQQQHAFDEQLHVHSQHFSHQVCQQWEQLALKAQSNQTRVCLLRTGIVLARHGGALKKMLPAYRLGLGGPIADGQQYLPWIHMQDMLRAILFLLETEHAQGAYNLCAPHPVPNAQFSLTLANTLQRPHLLTIPRWLIQLLMGEASELLLDSQRAKPKKLTDLGFQFNYCRIESALQQLYPNNLELQVGGK